MANDTATKGTFVHPKLTKVGTMTGHVKANEPDVFFPEEQFHTPLFDHYGIEALEGLYLDQGTFTPAQ